MNHYLNILICLVGIVIAVPYAWESRRIDKSVPAVKHTVTVGGDAGLVYNPPSIHASIGDVIEFVFQEKNHTLTQSSFEEPCTALPGGMDSGFIPNPDGAISPTPKFRYTVKSLEPSWWFCRQRDHCQLGMVFAINPTEAQTFDTFRKTAMSVSTSKGSSAMPASISDENVDFPNDDDVNLLVATVYTVTVGGGGELVFSPPSVNASIGDVVHFVFAKQNHSVTQSTFESPCVALSNGIDSGYLPNPNDSIIPAPSFEYVVTDDKPSWWFCPQHEHCQRGMVFAINPTLDNTIDMFIKAAKGTGKHIIVPPVVQPKSSLTDSYHESDPHLESMENSNELSGSKWQAYTCKEVEPFGGIVGNTLLS